MGADRHAFVGGGERSLPHDGRVSAVESAGDIRAADQGQHGCIVTEAPVTVGLTQVAVEVNLEGTSHREAPVKPPDLSAGR